MAGYLQDNQAAGRSKPVTAPALGAMRAAGQKIQRVHGCSRVQGLREITPSRNAAKNS